MPRFFKPLCLSLDTAPFPLFFLQTDGVRHVLLSSTRLNKDGISSWKKDPYFTPTFRGKVSGDIARDIFDIVLVATA